ncbi:hypothetical protein GCM10027562_00150 [Arthrobacter pigmenti]
MPGDSARVAVAAPVAGDCLWFNTEPTIPRSREDDVSVLAASLGGSEAAPVKSSTVPTTIPAKP